MEDLKQRSLRTIIFISLVLFTLRLTAQVSTFNQLGSLPSTNPAFIANLGKDQLALISRNQWPGNKIGSFTSELSYNKFFENINSSFGILANYSFDHQGSLSSLSQSLQYGYRVLFLDRFYLCTGLGLNHKTTELDLNNFQYLYEPKRTYLILPEKMITSESSSASAGIFLHDWMENQYLGFSIKDQPVMQLKNSGSGQLQISPSFSIQGMKGIPWTREVLLISLFEIERTGKMVYTIPDTGTTVLHPSYYYFSFQENVYINRLFMFGIGYKYFTKNYGCFNARLNFFKLGDLPLLIGFSVDTKPYIQNDRIKTNSGYEFYLKYSFYKGR